MKRQRGGRMGMVGAAVCLALAWSMWIFPGTPAQAQPPEDWKEGIAYDVAPSAKITKVSFYMGKTESGSMYFMKWNSKRILQGDPVQADHLSPGRGPGLRSLSAHGKEGETFGLEPKEEMTQKWPVFAKELPKGFALVVKEVEE